MSESENRHDRAVQAAIEVGLPAAANSDQFNSACAHIVQLLSDAARLLGGGSHATAAFLSITAIEEVAKLHIGVYRRGNVAAKRSDDPLFRHSTKHLIGVGPTVALGVRLRDAVGDKRMHELIEMSQNSGLTPIREAALYFERKGDDLVTPISAVPRTLSRELLLLACEVFDDALVGYTKESLAYGAEVDALFAAWQAPG